MIKIFEFDHTITPEEIEHELNSFLHANPDYNERPIVTKFVDGTGYKYVQYLFCED